MPSPREHTRQVHAYDDVYLTCRDLRHHWQVVGFYRHPNGTVRRVVDCERCGTQREDQWRPDGERIASAYSYARDYQLSDGFSYLEVRREVMARATIYRTQAAMVAALTSASGTPKVRRGNRSPKK